MSNHKKYYKKQIKIPIFSLMYDENFYKFERD